MNSLKIIAALTAVAVVASGCQTVSTPTSHSTDTKVVFGRDSGCITNVSNSTVFANTRCHNDIPELIPNLHGDI